MVRFQTPARPTCHQIPPPMTRFHHPNKSPHRECPSQATRREANEGLLVRVQSGEQRQRPSFGWVFCFNQPPRSARNSANFLFPRALGKVRLIWFESSRGSSDKDPASAGSFALTSPLAPLGIRRTFYFLARSEKFASSGSSPVGGSKQTARPCDRAVLFPVCSPFVPRNHCSAFSR